MFSKRFLALLSIVIAVALAKFDEVTDLRAYGTYSSAISKVGTNLVEYGPTVGDQAITNNQQPNGYKILLYHNFPFYGGRYNYTLISTNGYVGFGYFSDSGSHDFLVGKDSGYPTKSDPAFIAPYLCRQKVGDVPGQISRIHFRLEMRSTSSSQYSLQHRDNCFENQRYAYCDNHSNSFLDKMQLILQEGVAGASAFRCKAALIVTWENIRPNIGKANSYSTYQLVWLTDALGTLSYTIINYDRLGYEASDVNGNTATGRCQALFNGGNQTGTVMVDLSLATKERPSSLAERSAVPHIVRGRYLHRVDDIVRPCGCSNKTGGSFPMMIYPNIVNMLGQKSVEVNALCLDPNRKYSLMIEQRDTASCDVINSAIARCHLPKILDWGTKTVYFQPADLAHEEKAYIGYMYFVPPTLDPMRLDIGDVYQWFKNPVPDEMRISWFPRNFTNRALTNTGTNVDNPALYAMQLGLYVIGYKEASDKRAKKFIPTYRVLARINTFSNPGEERWRWLPYTQEIRTTDVQEWYMNEWEREEEIYTYRFGFLKLAPVITTTVEKGSHLDDKDLSSGLLSTPISLHWLWTIGESSASSSGMDREEKRNFVKRKATHMCNEWFDEDGTLTNFIRTTETNASCPCKEIQAKLDLGRFMPHPRCSQLFRDVTCTETLGSRNCYMSAQNVRGVFSDNSHAGHESSYATHYGQVCCYDESGYLMQTSYQPLIKIDESTPYSPGFPMRAYEFGTYPYQGMFEVPGLSAFHHDMMPYYLCCKYADFRCQMFYWRRPSSACQEYDAPNVASVMGAGTITTLNRNKYIYNDPGIYNLLYAEETHVTPQVHIQGRFERFPDRSVPFASADQQQEDLVQPSNVTVLTGIALETSDSDRVHVILRKDTARERYRTTILVNDVIRYFDHMQLQRFKGVTIYVNDVQRGQAEVYVVLDKAQIGIRVRESYALDMDRFSIYMESFGLLDLLVSVPPQYRTRTVEDTYGEKALIDGLLCPEDDTIRTPEVNINQKIADYSSKYRVKGEIQVATYSRSFHTLNAFQVDLFDSPADSMWSVLPDADLKRAVYVAGDVYYRRPYYPPTVETLEAFKDFCRIYETGSVSPEEYSQWKKQYNRCPKSVVVIEALCGDDKSCQIDAIYLQAQVLVAQFRLANMAFTVNVALDNSCGAISLEYPEYMRKEPKSSAPAYLEGDHASFSCFQEHVSKGDVEYHCTREQSYHDSNVYITRWNQGSQPWCRPRGLQNLLTWLFWSGIILGALLVLVITFACCWWIKRRHINKIRTRRNSVASVVKVSDTRRGSLIEMEPLKSIQPIHYEKNVKRSPSSSLNDTYFSSDSARPAAFHRSSSQPYIPSSQAFQYALPVRINAIPSTQQRRPSYSGLSGLSTGV